jgi:hypothetical protein
MTRDNLRERLDAADVDPDAYRLNGERADEAYVLEPQATGWSVYYSERGLRTGEQLFADEATACACLLDMLLRDAGARRR